VECRVPTLHGEHRRACIVVTEVRQHHRDEDQHRRRGDTDERVCRANRTAAHLARFGHDGRLELVERRVRGSAELLGGSTELLARRLARRSVTRLTVLGLAGLAEGSLLALLRLRTELRLALLTGLAEGSLLGLSLLGSSTVLGLTGLLTEGSLLSLLRLRAKLRLTLLSLLTLLGSSTVLGLTGLLTEGGLLALLRLGAKLGLTLRLSVYLRRVAEGRLRDLFFGRQGGSGLVARRGLGLRRTLEDCLLEVVIVCLGGLAHGSLGLDVGSHGLDVGSLGLDVGNLGFCGSLNVRLFDHGLLDGGLGRGGVSLGLRFFVDTGERLGLLAGFLRGGLGLGDRRFLSSRGLRGNDTLVR